MYTPNFHITNQTLLTISQIENAKAIIDSSPLIPAYEHQFQKDAVVRTVHYGTHLEGNDLSFHEVAKIIDGQKTTGTERDIQEVINYRNVMTYLEELWSQYDAGLPLPEEPNNFASDRPFFYSQTILTKVQFLTVDKIVAKEHAGTLRKGEVTLRNSQTGEVIHQPPPAIEVPYLVSDFLGWLNSPTSRLLHPVIRAAITHYILIAIHPFAEGNGRVARAFSLLLLHTEGYNIKRLFSLEEHFDRNPEDYYSTIQQTDQSASDLAKRDLTTWIDYFSQSLAIELTRIKEKVLKLSADYRLKKHLGGKQVALSDRQIKLVEYIREFGGIRMPDARELLPMVSDDTIWRDLRYLMETKLVYKKGSTKAALYCLVE